VVPVNARVRLTQNTQELGHRLGQVRDAFTSVFQWPDCSPAKTYAHTHTRALTMHKAVKTKVRLTQNMQELGHRLGQVRDAFAAVFQWPDCSSVITTSHTSKTDLYSTEAARAQTPHLEQHKNSATGIR